MKSKAELRLHLRAVVDLLDKAEHIVASAQSGSLLRRQPVWEGAQAILFYAPIAGEIDLTTMLEQALASGKAVALPAFVHRTGTYDAFQISNLARDCVPGRFGIFEPAPACPAFPLNRLDLTLVPGLGFDLTGHRLGRGGGFYDRLLARVSGAKCGVGFDAQIVPQVPAETHDVRMDFILTPTRWLTVPSSLSAQP
jgi:5-formyltetrahydrofolate cyclo-ligase